MSPDSNQDRYSLNLTNEDLYFFELAKILHVEIMNESLIVDLT